MRKIMSRKNLKKIGALKRHRFRGTFEKYGFKYSDWKKEHAKPTLLLTEIYLIHEDEIELISDHIWLNLTLGFNRLGILTKGDIVAFDGRVATYQKGYYLKGYSKDYKISHPSKVVLEKSVRTEHEKFPEQNRDICNMIYDLYQDDYLRRSIPKPYIEY